jgi:hypothetical protein
MDKQILNILNDTKILFENSELSCVATVEDDMIKILCFFEANKSGFLELLDKRLLNDVARICDYTSLDDENMSLVYIKFCDKMNYYTIDYVCLVINEIMLMQMSKLSTSSVKFLSKSDVVDMLTKFNTNYKAYENFILNPVLGIYA